MIHKLTLTSAHSLLSLLMKYFQANSKNSLSLLDSLRLSHFHCSGGWRLQKSEEQEGFSLVLWPRAIVITVRVCPFYHLHVYAKTISIFPFRICSWDPSSGMWAHSWSDFIEQLWQSVCRTLILITDLLNLGLWLCTNSMSCIQCWVCVKARAVQPLQKCNDDSWWPPPGTTK